MFIGSLAQLARAPRLHRGGRGFEPLATHHDIIYRNQPSGCFLLFMYYSRVKISHIFDENDPTTKNHPSSSLGVYLEAFLVVFPIVVFFS